VGKAEEGYQQDFPVPPYFHFPFRLDELKPKGHPRLGFCGIKATLPQMQPLFLHVQVNR